MEMPTYTALYRIPVEIYKFKDVWLPLAPWGLFDAVGVLVGCLFDALLIWAFGFQVGAFMWVYAVPPAGAAWLSRRPFADGKMVPALVWTKIRHAYSRKVLDGYGPSRGGGEIRYTVQTWQRLGADWAATP